MKNKGYLLIQKHLQKAKKPASGQTCSVESSRRYPATSLFKAQSENNPITYTCNTILQAPTLKQAF
jgi:hypothetical protein